MSDTYSAPPLGAPKPTAAPPDKPDKPVDKEELFTKLKGWVSADLEKSSAWRGKAKEDFAFQGGDQWSEDDRNVLREQMRPLITMNRIDPIIDSVSGSEVSNRQEVRYIAREQGDVQVNEVLTSAAQWFRDNCDAEDEESDAFRDTLIAGMGWTETRLDYEEEPDGEPKIERIDPLDMVWDSSATKRNLTDARRVAHIRKIPLSEAKALVPDHDDEDYHAAWVDNADAGSGDVKSIDERNRYGSDGKDDSTDDDEASKMVTIVRVQWWERASAMRVVDPMNPQSIKTVTMQEHDDLQAKMKTLGMPPLQSVRTQRRVYKQAWLGAKLLEQGPAPCKEHFSWDCITGKRDRNAGEWYGLVRGMKDPQRWANKWLSQSLHILNTTAKGGIMAERGSFDDDEKAEKSWAKSDQITWTKPGAAAGGKIQPKPSGTLPTGFYQLMEFAISSIRDTSGVNVETLGMREAGQAASLEHMRKQSSMTILQPLFDSLRRYRKLQGRKMLYIIREYLSDGRLVRIVGKEQERYVPLVRTQGADKYDVIVDEAPTSPNQKEATWDMLQQILPAIGKIIPPKTWIAMLKYSPLPSSAQEDIKASMEPEKGPDGQPVPPPPDPEVLKAQQSMQMAQQKGQQDMQMAQAKAMQDSELVKAQHELEQKKALAEFELEKQRMQFQFQLDQQKQNLELQLAQQKAAIDVHVENERSKAQIASNQTAPISVQSNSTKEMATALSHLGQMMQAVHEHARAPKRVLRDGNGAVIGVETVLQ